MDVLLAALVGMVSVPLAVAAIVAVLANSFLGLSRTKTVVVFLVVFGSSLVGLFLYLDAAGIVK